MKRIVKRAVLGLLVVTACNVVPADAANIHRGGYTIQSHRSGNSYWHRSIRTMFGRGVRDTRYTVGAGHYTRGGSSIIETYRFGRVTSWGSWSGGPTGFVQRDRSRRNENFVFIYSNQSRYSIVNNIDFF